MKQSGHETVPTRGSLLNRLKQWDDDKSWQEFFNLYWRLIYSVALRSGLSDAEAQDVVQETTLCVAKKIRSFEYNPNIGSFKSWLLTQTRYRILDYVRKRSREELLSGSDANAEVAADFETACSEIDGVWEQEWKNNLLEVALENLRKRVKPRQFQLFDSFVLKQWPMDAVKRRLKANAGQVYFAKYKLSALLRKELHKLQRELSEPA